MQIFFGIIKNILMCIKIQGIKLPIDNHLIIPNNFENIINIHKYYQNNISNNILKYLKIIQSEIHMNDKKVLFKTS
jgi:hypothetical protein